MKPRDDQDAWEAYPEHRWVFNKLEVALKLGYEAGPAAVPVKRSGSYIIRPLYNLYGMGIGARRIYLRRDDKQAIEQHEFIPPGYFWCDFFEGIHYSIDLKYVYAGIKNEKSRWETISTSIGTREGDDLSTFDSWELVNEVPNIEIPSWFDQFQNVGIINIEVIGKHIIEIHLRAGNTEFDDCKVGTKLIPIFKNDPLNKLEELQNQGFLFNDNYDKEIWHASGHLNNARIGYFLCTPIIT